MGCARYDANQYGFYLPIISVLFHGLEQMNSSSFLAGPVRFKWYLIIENHISPCPFLKVLIQSYPTSHKHPHRLDKTHKWQIPNYVSYWGHIRTFISELLLLQ